MTWKTAGLDMRTVVLWAVSQCEGVPSILKALQAFEISGPFVP